MVALVKTEVVSKDNPMEAWKVLDRWGRSTHFDFLPTTEWQEAKRERIKESDISVPNAPEYLSGFHCFLSEKDARRSWLMVYGISKKSCRVQIAGEVIHGFGDGSPGGDHTPVVVAQYIRLAPTA
jgi:hypothetical protein